MAGGRYVDAVGGNGCAFHDLDDVHVGDSLQEFGEHALVLGRQVLEHHECSPARCWSVREELLKCLQAAC